MLTRLIYIRKTDVITTVGMILSRRPLWPANIRLDGAACMLCQWRSFSTSYRRLAQKETPAPAPAPANPPQPAEPLPSPLQDAPRAYGKALEEFTPKPLSRPIGLPKPPKAGENTGIDNRTWKERRDDFVNYEKHLARRKDLWASYLTSTSLSLWRQEWLILVWQYKEDIQALLPRME